MPMVLFQSMWRKKTENEMANMRVKRAQDRSDITGISSTSKKVLNSFIHFIQQQRTKRPLTSRDKIQYDVRAIANVYIVHTSILVYTYTHICIHTPIAKQVLRTVFKVK